MVEVDGGFNGAVGDLNGDGYDDLLLSEFSAADFVFGSKERLHGLIPRGSAGVFWKPGALPPLFSADLRIRFSVRGAGDLDGDGCDDLIVQASAIQGALSIADRAWVMRGHLGQWQSTDWDASSAVADFGFGPSPVPSDDMTTV